MKSPHFSIYCSVANAGTAGTAGNYVAMSAPLLNQKLIRNGPIVVLPNDSTIQATHSDQLLLLELLFEAKID